MCGGAGKAITIADPFELNFNWADDEMRRSRNKTPTKIGVEAPKAWKKIRNGKEIALMIVGSFMGS